MTHKEFLKNYILPFCIKNDKPANRQLYNDTKDQLQRDGLITEKQDVKWVYPSTKLFD